MYIFPRGPSHSHWSNEKTVYDHLEEFLNDPLYYNHPRREDLQSMPILSRDLGRAVKSRFVVSVLRATATLVRTPACGRKTQSKGPDVAKEEIPVLSAGTVEVGNALADPNPPPIEEPSAEDQEIQDVDDPEDEYSDEDTKKAIRASLSEMEKPGAAAEHDDGDNDPELGEAIRAPPAEARRAAAKAGGSGDPKASGGKHGRDDEDGHQLKKRKRDHKREDDDDAGYVEEGAM